MFLHSGRSLVLHKKTHTGDKPYECDICKKKFSQLGHLARHAFRLSKVLSRPFYGALRFLCRKDFCHLQRAKYHQRTSLFTLKAELILCRSGLHYRSLSKESKNNIIFSGFFVEQICIIEANRVNNVNTILKNTKTM
jgi:hypothetical protein